MHKVVQRLIFNYASAIEYENADADLSSPIQLQNLLYMTHKTKCHNNNSHKESHREQDLLYTKCVSFFNSNQ